MLTKLNLFASGVERQVVKVQLPPEGDFQAAVEDVLVKQTKSFDLVSTETIRMPLIISTGTQANAVLVVMLAALCSFAVVSRMLRKLDLVGVLKARD